MEQSDNNNSGSRIAIVGMSIRCPGAANVEEFWSNLKNGVESITIFSDDELRQAGIPDSVLSLPTFVKAGAPLKGLEMFDAEFFNYSAREAEFIDPQHRVFLEVAVEALENAGVDPSRHPGSISVFAGEGQVLYGIQILSNKSVIGVDRQMAVIGNDKDYLATRASYKLGLRGPAFTVQCACSTSTVAVHLAMQSLLSGESDVALAGGVSVSWLRGIGGYHFVEGGILSRDGHTRAFDARASGTIFADGAGLVVLKRLEDAIAEGDDIKAVIVGTAVNNDGSAKISYTAPAVDGQSAVFSEALSVAGVSAASIGYMEAHGTGTGLGDPIEVEALQRVFRIETERKQFCGLGSLKSNIGHLNTISGLAGVIKASYCVRTGEIPPSLHYETPNPKIDFANSPFFVLTELTKWTGPSPRRAGVSAFGIGGTNTEVIVEEPPVFDVEPSAKSTHVAIVSTKSAATLDAACERLARHLRDNVDENIADVCHTLMNGRTPYQHVRAIVCTGPLDAAEALESNDRRVTVEGLRGAPGQPVTFLFSGQGSQHIFMGRELYGEEPVFRSEVDRCAELLKPHIGLDIRHLMFPEVAAEQEASERLRETRYAQPAIFTVSYALAKLWMSLGVRPAVALGHSIGEFAAACIAEVFSLEDALRAVAARGRLMQSMPAGSMLAVMAPAEQVEKFLPASVSIAAINAPTACVASGPTEDITALAAVLSSRSIASTPLHTSHAFHSAMMDPAVEPFVEVMRGIELKPPQIAYISNVTGHWITDEQATDPVYWGRQLRGAVYFHKGLTTIQDQVSTVLLEVGPGRSLGNLARSIAGAAGETKILSSMGPSSSLGVGEVKAFLLAAADLWIAGASVALDRRYEGERRLKRPLPTYPFARQRYWALDSEKPAQASGEPVAVGVGEVATARSGSCLMETTSWKRLQYAASEVSDLGKLRWLVVVSKESLGRGLADMLLERGADVTVVEKAGEFSRVGPSHFKLDFAREDDLNEICATAARRLGPEQRLRVVYFCEPSSPRPAEAVASAYRMEVDDKVNGPIVLIRSLMRNLDAKNVSLTLVTCEAQAITGAETIDPMMALPIGPCLAGMHEYPGLRCRVVDVEAAPAKIDLLLRQLASDIAEPSQSVITAYRGAARWARTVEPIPLFLLGERPSVLRQDGVYLITGGLGDLGLAVAGQLATKYRAKLVLLSRTPLPPRETWETVLAGSGDESRVVRMIRGVMRIEASGGQVMTAAADVCDLAQMREVLQEARARFGEVNGVIHAAGVSGNTPIGLKTREDVDVVLESKILGLAVLTQTLAESALDFLALFSSTSAIWGRVGQADYTAANAYLDAYAIGSQQDAKWPTISINWDNWREVGMAVNTLRAAPGQTQPPEVKVGLATAEALQAFEEALAARHPQVIARADNRRTRARAVGRGSGGPAGGQSSGAVAKPKAKRYPRPSLGKPYRAPETDQESALVALWTDLLMIDPIGIDDNFFELGGHSLLALQLLPRIREKYRIALEPKELFENPTVAQLGAIIRGKPAA